mmetsp:Transcript_5808/g.14164  ORF Transcript_5808/g.14164 Transcript_5808/m.14164 type:complete len:80 (+) Transcript_5808:5-244(+)
MLDRQESRLLDFKVPVQIDILQDQRIDRSKLNSSGSLPDPEGSSLYLQTLFRQKTTCIPHRHPFTAIFLPSQESRHQDR